MPNDKNEIQEIYKIIDELKEEIHQRDIQLVSIRENLNRLNGCQEKFETKEQNLLQQLQNLTIMLQTQEQDISWVRDLRKLMQKLLVVAIISILSALGNVLILLLKFILEKQHN